MPRREWRVLCGGNGFLSKSNFPPRPPPREGGAEARQDHEPERQVAEAAGQLGGWTDTWETPGTLPLQVSIDLADKDGRAWPSLVVALPLAGSEGSGLGDMLQAHDRL